MTVEKNRNGSYVIGEFVGNDWVKQVYYGYTKKEAIAKFKDYLKTYDRFAR